MSWQSDKAGRVNSAFRCLSIHQFPPSLFLSKKVEGQPFPPSLLASVISGRRLQVKIMPHASMPRQRPSSTSTAGFRCLALSGYVPDGVVLSCAVMGVAKELDLVAFSFILRVLCARSLRLVVIIYFLWSSVYLFEPPFYESF
jgi:hypothetical protein